MFLRLENKNGATWGMPARTSKITLRCSPKPSPSTVASANDAILVPSNRLMTNFIADPDPLGPTWTTLVPRHNKSGRIFSTSDLSPPTQKTSLPSAATGAEPVTGASRKRTLRRAASVASILENDGFTVLQSTHTV